MAWYNSFIFFLLALLLAGFFKGIEIAFITADRLSVELRKKQGKQSSLFISQMLDEPLKFLGSSLTGFNIFLVIYGLLFSMTLSELWQFLKMQNDYFSLTTEIVIASLIAVLFIEFTPKAFFKAKADTVLSYFTPLFSFFYSIFQPLAALLADIAEYILKYLFNVRIRKTDEPFSKVDVDYFMQQAREQDESYQELNKELLQNALSLPNVKIRQCLIPRTEIEAIEISAPVEEARKKFIETKLSRIVVYEENIDNIRGYIHQLDLFKKPSSLDAVLLPISVVPETMSATDMINKFSKEQKSMAWVVDEFGGTAGIVTIEDVLEEIFGEIKDEYDTEEFIEKQVAENEYLFSGRLELDYLNHKYDFDFPGSDSETLSGYIIQQHETIPKKEERIIIEKYEFDVLNVSDTRIETVKMKVLG